MEEIKTYSLPLALIALYVRVSLLFNVNVAQCQHCWLYIPRVMEPVKEGRTVHDPRAGKKG